MRLVRKQNAEEGSRDAQMREDEEEKGTNHSRLGLLNEIILGYGL